MSCSNKVKQLSIALHNYHDTYSGFPAGCVYNFKGGTITGDGTTDGQAGPRISGFIALLPFCEQGSLYEKINSGLFRYNWNLSAPDTALTGGGTDCAASSIANPPITRLTFLFCPSDAGNSSSDTEPGRTNYRFCYGDYPVYGSVTATTQCEIVRGAFAFNKWYGMESLSDGTSNTAVFSERVIAPNTTERRIRATHVYVNLAEGDPSQSGAFGAFGASSGDSYNSDYRGKGGARWGDGDPHYTGFLTIVKPNGKCFGAYSAEVPITHVTSTAVTASSNHSGGVMVGLADGSVRFISETIDSGADITGGYTYSSVGVSDFGIWGAYGTRNGGESKTLP
jgi:prepilin-type processing-associated H-X9-DG protein